MIKKTFNSNSNQKPVILQDIKDEGQFEVGSQYMSYGQKWRVLESFVSDNTPMRRISNSSGYDSIIMLKTLLEDIKDNKEFSFLPDDEIGLEMRKNASKK